jgi:hypothetical protein
MLFAVDPSRGPVAIMPKEYTAVDAGASVLLFSAEAQSSPVAEIRSTTFNAWLAGRCLAYLSW